MKRIAIILVMAFVFVAGVNAQQYINVKRACPQCMGYGAANNGIYTRTSYSVTVYTEDCYKKVIMQYICMVVKNTYLFPTLGYVYKVKAVWDIMEIGM